MPERDPRRTIHHTPIAARGISDQPSHLRLPGQMEEAQNVQLSVVDGASKRPGTEYMTPITLDGGANWRVAPLVISPTEKYIIVYGFPASDANATVRIFRVSNSINWTEATVTIDSAAQTYLNRGNADTLRFVPISKDETLIICTTVTVTTDQATAFTLTASWRDYGVMIAQTPADATYHQAIAADVDEGKPAGFYKYNVSGTTFAKVQFPVVTGRDDGTPVGRYDNSGGHGFKIRCRKYNISFVNGTWTAGTLTMTKAGAFTNYVFQNGDELDVDAVGGLAAGFYRITSRVDANSVTLATSPGADTVNASVTDGVSVEFDVQAQSDAISLVDMYAVAEWFQDAARAAGATDALISWTETGSASGYFTFTSPFRGSGATILGTSAPGSGEDLSVSGRGFYFTGATVTAGAGAGSLTLALASRWTQVSPAGAPDGSIKVADFPVRLLRTAADNFKINQVTPAARASGDHRTNPSPSIFSKQGDITSVSIANPSIITSALHGLRSGAVVALSGLGTTPALSGTYQPITVVDENSFSIPVNVTAVADGVGTWVKSGASINDAIVHRGRLGLFGGRFAVFSRVNDYFNFFLEDYQNIVDSDPIDAPIGGREVPDIDFVADFRGTLIAFSTSARQYEFGSPEALTPTTASWTARTRYSTYSIRPVLMGSYCYFVGPRTNKSVAWELYYDDARLVYDAGEISAHVRDLLPASLRAITAGVNEHALLILPTGNGSESKLDVYRAFWDGIRKDLSEWVEYIFDSGVRISDLCVIDGDVYLLTETTGIITEITATNPAVIRTATPHNYAGGETTYISEATTTPTVNGARVVTVVDATRFSVAVNVTSGQALNTAGVGRWSNTDYMIEKLSLSREDRKTGYPYTIHLDRRLELNGVFAAGNTTWTLPFPSQGSTINRAVRKTTGAVVDLSGAVYSGNTIVIAGDYSGLSYLGRNFDYRLQLTPPYYRDDRGVADQQVAILLSSITIAHVSSGDYKVRVDYDDARSDITTTFTPTAMTETGRFVAMTRGDGEHMTVFLESNSPKPLTIAGFQQQGDFAFGLR